MSELERLAAAFQQTQPKQPDILAALGAYSLGDITDQDKRPPEFLVDGMISVGLSILFGPPKVRKSFLALQMGISVATGADFLDFPTKQCGVVYFDLEGSKNRTATRSERMTAKAPKNLLFINSTSATLADTSDKGLAETIRAIHRQHPEVRLYIIDTLATARGKVKASGGNAYNDDVTLLKPLHDMAAAEEIAVLLIHHTRKGSAAFSDEFDRVNGTTGLTGTADNVLDLSATGTRSEGRGVLKYTPRDAKSGEINLQFDEDRLAWRNASYQEARAEANPIIKYLLDSVLDYPRTVAYADISAHFAQYGETYDGDEIRAAVKEFQLSVYTEKGIVLSAGHRCSHKYKNEEGETVRGYGRGVLICHR